MGLWLHNNRFTAIQVTIHRSDVVPHGHIDEFTELLTNFDLLSGMDRELEVLWSLKD